MDHFDKAILDIIQSHYPLVSRPYAAIGESVGLTEAEVLARVRALKATGVIRRIGANFPSRDIGWHSTLCAARVPADKVETFVAEVNSYPGVTHNYRRENEFNIWFTFIGETVEIVKDTLAAITAKTGVPIFYLPALRTFKIKVDFPMQADKLAEEA